MYRYRITKTEGEFPKIEPINEFAKMPNGILVSWNYRDINKNLADKPIGYSYEVEI